MPCHRPGQHDGGGGARPWPSGAGGQARGAGLGTPGTPGPWGREPTGPQGQAPGLAPSATWPWPGPAAAIVLLWTVAWNIIGVQD